MLLLSDLHSFVKKSYWHSDGTIRRFIGRVWRYLHHSRPAYRGVDRMRTLNRQIGCLWTPVNAGDRSREWSRWRSAIDPGRRHSVSPAVLTCALLASTSIGGAAGADAAPIDLAPHLMRVQLGAKVETQAPKDSGPERPTKVTVPDRKSVV